MCAQCLLCLGDDLATSRSIQEVLAIGSGMFSFYFKHIQYIYVKTKGAIDKKDRSILRLLFRCNI